MAEPVADIGLIGLDVMGQNLILNMNDNGFIVCAYDKTTQKVDEFLKNEAKGTKIVGAHSLKEMVNKLKWPRRIMMLDKAGPNVDIFIHKLIPLLERDDIIIDGSNSACTDTQRRYKDLRRRNLLFIGVGISGGEEGARYGPSIMPGGHFEAWRHVKNIFQQTSAKVDGEPCCYWVGKGEAGNYVKMIHDNIEYGHMQLRSEAYSIMKNALDLNYDEMSKAFEHLNKPELNSFLIEITADVLRYKQDGKYLATKIWDCTGKLILSSALDLGVPVTLIGESVFSRYLSSLKEERVKARKLLSVKQTKYTGNKQEFVEHLRRALYASKIISYVQGFMLLKGAAKKYNWNLDYGKIALMWRGGFMNGSVFLDNIKKAFDKNKNLENLLFDEFFKNAITESEQSLRFIVSEALKIPVAVPCFSSAAAFFVGYTSDILPADLIQVKKNYWCSLL